MNILSHKDAIEVNGPLGRADRSVVKALAMRAGGLGGFIPRTHVHASGSDHPFIIKQRLYRASWLWRQAISVSSGFDWKTLPQ